ncbi:MAG TPA: histidine phosphatase family protein [Polyangiaceae bacterium]|nr:histidine phosphatase family protein [Polyangiaceae bacterium]
MSTRIVLIRHGETTLSAENRFAGATDVDLSDAGRAQAESLGRRLSTERLAAVYTSPLKRTRDTAAAVARPHRLAPIEDPGLREIDHGHWETLTRAEVETRYPDEYRAWEHDPFTFAPEGGESGLSVMARALPIVRKIVAAHGNATVAVVSHKATIRLLLCGLLGIDPRGYRDRFDQAPCCLNLVELEDPTRARLMAYNDINHYAGGLTSVRPHLSPWWDAHANAEQGKKG